MGVKYSSTRIQMPLITSTIRIVTLSASLALGATSVARADAPTGLPGSGSGVANPRLAVAQTAAESAKGKVTELRSKLDEAKQKRNAVNERLTNEKKTLGELQAK